MLGEAVLSLLIVDAPEGSEYFIAFYSGILTITLGQYLHFQSQPHHANDHAMRRNKNAGILWRGMNIVYSVQLFFEIQIFIAPMYGNYYIIFRNQIFAM